MDPIRAETLSLEALSTATGLSFYGGKTYLLGTPEGERRTLSEAHHIPDVAKKQGNKGVLVIFVLTPDDRQIPIWIGYNDAEGASLSSRARNTFLTAQNRATKSGPTKVHDYLLSKGVVAPNYFLAVAFSSAEVATAQEMYEFALKNVDFIGNCKDRRRNRLDALDAFFGVASKPVPAPAPTPTPTAPPAMGGAGAPLPADMRPRGPGPAFVRPAAYPSTVKATPPPTPVAPSRETLFMEKTIQRKKLKKHIKAMIADGADADIIAVLEEKVAQLKREIKELESE